MKSFLDIFCFFQSGIVLTISMLILCLYAGDKRIIHIASIAAAHIILTLLAVMSVYEGFIKLMSVHGLLLVTSFLLTDFALFILMKISVTHRAKTWMSGQAERLAELEKTDDTQESPK